MSMKLGVIIELDLALSELLLMVLLLLQKSWVFTLSLNLSGFTEDLQLRICSSN